MSEKSVDGWCFTERLTVHEFLNKWNMRVCINPLIALEFAHGSFVWKIRGIVEREEIDGRCQYKTYTLMNAGVDATDVLNEFARRCALYILPILEKDRNIDKDERKLAEMARDFLETNRKQLREEILFRSRISFLLGSWFYYSWGGNFAPRMCVRESISAAAGHPLMAVRNARDAYSASIRAIACAKYRGTTAIVGDEFTATADKVMKAQERKLNDMLNTLIYKEEDFS